MKYIISSYFWIVGVLYFGMLLVLAIILTFIVPTEKLDPWLKKGCRLLFKLLHTRVEVEGIEKIDPEKTYLFMANHVSGFDIPVLEAYIPVLFRGVQAKHHFNWPVFGLLIRRLGNIPMDRKNILASIRSMGKTRALLEEGKSIVILPEGHRTLDGNLMPFKRLPFHMAKKAGVEVVPIGMSGLFKFNKKGSFLISPTTLKVKFGDPIRVDQTENLPVDDLKMLIRHDIEALIEYP